MSLQSPVRTPNLSLAFSCVGHFFNHLFEPIFFVVALVLPPVLGIPYEQVLPLILVGKIMTGVMAPVAGWLADRWSTTGMITVYFLGMGAAGAAVGFAETPMQIAITLTALGVFGSIYHPVGIAWLVRESANRGRDLGINGMFGGLGPAAGGILAGALIEWVDWRATFVAPGLLMIAVGIAFAVLRARGRIVEAAHPVLEDPPQSKRDTVRVYLILTAAMLIGAIIYQGTQASLPKAFENRLGDALGTGTLGVGTAVMIVYGFAGAMQIAFGALADRYPLKWVYAGSIALQVPMLSLAAAATGMPLLVAAVLMVTLNIGTLPAENSLMARFTPPQWRGTAYGLKYVLAFGVSGIGIWLAAAVRETTGDFTLLYAGMAGAIALVAAVAVLLPREAAVTPSAPAPEPQPAE